MCNFVGSKCSAPGCRVEETTERKAQYLIKSIDTIAYSIYPVTTVHQRSLYISI